MDHEKKQKLKRVSVFLNAHCLCTHLDFCALYLACSHSSFEIGFFSSNMAAELILLRIEIVNIRKSRDIILENSSKWNEMKHQNCNLPFL